MKVGIEKKRNGKNGVDAEKDVGRGKVRKKVEGGELRNPKKGPLWKGVM